MTAKRDRQRHHRRHAIDLPAPRSKATQVDHRTSNACDQHIHPLERLEDSGDFLPEVGVFLLLGGCTPLHVDAEQVSENGGAQVVG